MAEAVSRFYSVPGAGLSGWKKQNHSEAGENTGIHRGLYQDLLRLRRLDPFMLSSQIKPSGIKFSVGHCLFSKSSKTEPP